MPTHSRTSRWSRSNRVRVAGRYVEASQLAGLAVTVEADEGIATVLQGGSSLSVTASAANLAADASVRAARSRVRHDRSVLRRARRGSGTPGGGHELLGQCSAGGRLRGRGDPRRVHGPGDLPRSWSPAADGDHRGGATARPASGESRSGRTSSAVDPKLTVTQPGFDGDRSPRTIVTGRRGVVGSSAATSAVDGRADERIAIFLVLRRSCSRSPHLDHPRRAGTGSEGEIGTGSACD